MLAFVTNRSFIESRTFDGFRKTVASEFAEIRIVDLGGDVRANPKLSGTRHNVFGIQTGVAISFFVKRTGPKNRCRIFYTRRPELETAEEKLAFLSSAKLAALVSEEVRPDAKGNWLNLTHNDFDELLPVISKESKAAKSGQTQRSIFGLFSLGVVTARDEWVYDIAADSLATKVSWLIAAYNADVGKLSNVMDRKRLAESLDSSIKWSRAVKSDLTKGLRYTFDGAMTVEAMYRPFVKRHLYFDKHLNEVQYQLPAIFRGGVNPTITFLCVSSSNPLATMVVQQPFDYCLLKMGNGGTQSLPYWLIGDDGQRTENITDWSLKKFASHYKAGSGRRLPEPTKEAIFHYVYAALHDPAYREKYAQNLKRDFPRVPLYGATRADFWRWADWGRALMNLHIGYEQAAPWPLKRTDTPDAKVRAAGQQPKCVLKADPAACRVVIDSETVLDGVPFEAWACRLGNRCAIDWVLDQHKEKKPKDPTIREKFDSYRFADHKEAVIDLLMRVTTVSVETVRIVEAMKSAVR